MNNRRLTFVAAALTICVCALLYLLLESLRTPWPLPVTPTATATATQSLEPTGTPTASVSPTSTHSPTPTQTATATASPTLTPTATATAIAYTDAVALRHDAMESVFYWFPERRDLRADAFIAVYGCGQIGRWYWLRLPDGSQYRAVVTDCMQEKHRAAHRAKWGETVVIEIDGVFWRARGLTMVGGVPVGIAPLPEPF